MWVGRYCGIASGRAGAPGAPLSFHDSRDCTLASIMLIEFPTSVA